MTCTPSSCYRLPHHSGFTFDDAAATAPYLKELGISHIDCDREGAAAAPGGALRAQNLFKQFPVALLTRAGE